MRLLSEWQGGTALVLSATFVLGLGVGASISPVTAGRSAVEPASPPAPSTSAPAALRLAHPAEVLRVFDGDTFEAQVHLWPGLAITTRVRLRGIDTPEMKSRCEEERAQAEAARETLHRILAQGEVAIARVALDKYGGRVSCGRLHPLDARRSRSAARFRIGAAVCRWAPLRLVLISASRPPACRR